MMHRILLIDDQETIHEDYRKVLGPQESTGVLDQATAELFDELPELAVIWEGFELDSAFQGQQGFDLVQRSLMEGRPYAMAFVDIRMPPGWDGIQTVRRIWDVDSEILIVICSAYSDYSWEDMVTELGRSDRFLILKKPFDNIEVRQCAMVLTERWSVARTDPLTGLLNRRAFQQHIKLEWQRAVRYELPLSCAMLDLDFFKRINDMYGHAVGDAVLREVADRLLTRCRATDSICRYGGEELCVLLPHTIEEDATTWAEDMRRIFSEAPILVGHLPLQVTASFGVAERAGEGDDVQQLLIRADQALIRAKHLGRNRVVRATSMLEDSVEEDKKKRSRSDLFDNVTARDVMTGPIDCLPSNATVGEALKLWLPNWVRSAPVVDQEGRLVGIISEKELTDIMLNPDAWNMAIERILQRNVARYHEDEPVQAIYDFLSRVAVPQVIVVREDRPLGVVNRASLLRWFRFRMMSAEAANSEIAAPPVEQPSSAGTGLTTLGIIVCTTTLPGANVAQSLP